MARKLNVDRMRRYLARNTPDRVTMTFDLIDEEYVNQQRSFLDFARIYRRKMEIKHVGENVSIDAYVDPTLNHHSGGQITVVLVARIIQPV